MSIILALLIDRWCGEPPARIHPVVWMGSYLKHAGRGLPNHGPRMALFLGITYLAYDFGIVPTAHETVVSQLARHVFGAGALYYEIQFVTMLILLLAANTSFADFPRLASILARDRFLPRLLALFPVPRGRTCRSTRCRRGTAR